MKVRFERSGFELLCFWQDDNQDFHLRAQKPMFIMNFRTPGNLPTAKVRNQRMDFVQTAIQQAIDSGLQIVAPNELIRGGQ